MKKALAPPPFELIREHTLWRLSNGSEGRRAEVKSESFETTDFERANLTGGVFRNCNFNGSSFYKAILKDADFRGCDFSDCIFEGADLTGSRLDGCSFRGARVYIDRDWEGNEHTIMPAGWRDVVAQGPIES